MLELLHNWEGDIVASVLEPFVSQRMATLEERIESRLAHFHPGRRMARKVGVAARDANRLGGAPGEAALVAENDRGLAQQTPGGQPAADAEQQILAIRLREKMEEKVRKLRAIRDLALNAAGSKPVVGDAKEADARKESPAHPTTAQVAPGLLVKKISPEGIATFYSGE